MTLPVELSDIKVVYRIRHTPDRIALDGFSLSVGQEMLALLGPNGSGKSTLMGVIARTITPESGEMTAPKDRSGLAMVFQTPALDSLLTIRENLQVAAALHGLTKEAARANIEAISRDLDITDRLDDQIRRLSGGLARRADLARALVVHPSVLLLDEPTTGLDIDARRAFWEALDRIRSRLKMSIILATHLIDEAERSDRVVMMRDGQSILDDSPDALRDRVGKRVLRINAFTPERAGIIADWLSQQQIKFIHAETRIIASDVAPSIIESIPDEGAALTIAPPTLEDVYTIFVGSLSGGPNP